MPTLTLTLKASALREHRLRDRVGIRLETGYHLTRDRALDQPLDIAKEHMLVHAHERDRLAFGARASGAADAMDVVLGDIG